MVYETVQNIYFPGVFFFFLQANSSLSKQTRFCKKALSKSFSKNKEIQIWWTVILFIEYIRNNSSGNHSFKRSIPQKTLTNSTDKIKNTITVSFAQLYKTTLLLLENFKDQQYIQIFMTPNVTWSF